MSDEKDIIDYFIGLGTLMGILSAFVTWISAKVTDAKINGFRKELKVDKDAQDLLDAQEESETITILRGMKDQLTTLDKNTAISHAELKTEMATMNNSLIEQQKDITKIYQRSEIDGNRITVVETKVNDA